MTDLPDDSPTDAPAEPASRAGISTPPDAPEPPRKRSALRRMGSFVWRRPGTTFLALVAVVGAVPLVSRVLLPTVRMHLAWTDSSACVAKFEQPRGRVLPSCASFIHDYEHLADYALTHHDATYRAEELWARIMMASYLNATVGAPDPAERARTSKYVDDAQGVLEKGSQRISLDELGSAVMSPNRAKFAYATGDRETLVGSWEAWTLWSSRLQAVQAALVDADLQKALTIAGGYRDLEPREADLRTTVGSVLCLGPSPEEGVDFLERVPTDRYDKRYASIQRNYGEVLGVLKACAVRAHRAPPPLPPLGSAGVADMTEARLVESIRLAHDPDTLGDALDRAVVALQSEEGVEDKSSEWARAYLLAAVVARDAEAPLKPPTPTKSGGAPKKGEKDDTNEKREKREKAAPDGGSTDPLDDDSEDAPRPSSSSPPSSDTSGKSVPRHGATHVAPAPSGSASTGDPDDDAPPELDKVPTVFGDAIDRPAIADRLDPKLLANLARPRAKEGTLAPAPSHVLARILVEPPRLVPILPPEMLADAAAKLEKIALAAAAPTEATGVPVRPVLSKAAGAIAFHAGLAAARFGAPELAETQMRIAGRLLEFDTATTRLLVASAVYVAGDRKTALARLGASASADAPGVPGVEMESALLRARLLAYDDPNAALTEVRRALTLADQAKDAVLTSDARWMELALAPRSTASGPLLFPVYTGQADIDQRGSARFSEPAVDANFKAWTRAIAAPPDEQLAFRYKLFHQAGDAPADLGIYLLAGGRLLTDADGASTEVWLDAMTGLDRARFTFFGYAFARAEAAALRGDTESAATWSARRDAIRAVKASPDVLEIARFLNY